VSFEDHWLIIFEIIWKKLEFAMFAPVQTPTKILSSLHVGGWWTSHLRSTVPFFVEPRRVVRHRGTNPASGVVAWHASGVLSRAL